MYPPLPRELLRLVVGQTDAFRLAERLPVVDGRLLHALVELVLLLQTLDVLRTELPPVLQDAMARGAQFALVLRQRLWFLVLHLVRF